MYATISELLLSNETAFCCQLLLPDVIPQKNVFSRNGDGGSRHGWECCHVLTLAFPDSFIFYNILLGKLRECGWLISLSSTGLAGVSEWAGMKQKETVSCK